MDVNGYSLRKLADIHLIYGEARGVARVAVRLYGTRFPHRRLPSRRMFQDLHQRLQETGSLLPRRVERGPQRPQRIVNIEEEVLDVVHDDPGISTRCLAKRFNVSQWTIWRTLREQLLYPYHVQRVQALSPADYQPRFAFCSWFLRKVEENPDFPRIILASDEAGFTRRGIFNYHNVHVWADENPHAIRQTRFQQEFSINLWAGIVNNYLIGPFELPPRLTGAIYWRFLRRNLQELLEEVPLHIRESMWFLHDGAPPHFSRLVRQFLNVQFPEKWIGRGGAQHWPARSPDLNPLDFFFWGHMKSLVYTEEIRTEDHLRQRIHEATNIIRGDPEMLQRVQEQWIRRANACVRMNGAHFEHLL